MRSRRFRFRKGAFTFVEILVAAGVFSVLAVAMLTMWSGLQTSSVNTRAYAQRQSDQMRVFDYLKRDIRRASTIAIYNGATLVTGTAFGSELRVTIPNYYTDAREEDNGIGANTAVTPTLSGATVNYGTVLTVRYFVSNGAIIRSEGATSRQLADPAGAFAISFSQETSSVVRCRILFNQGLRSSDNRVLRRQVDVLCQQRSKLQT